MARALASTFRGPFPEPLAGNNSFLVDALSTSAASPSTITLNPILIIRPRRLLPSRRVAHTYHTQSPKTTTVIISKHPLFLRSFTTRVTAKVSQLTSINTDH